VVLRVLRVLRVSLVSLAEEGVLTVAAAVLGAVLEAGLVAVFREASAALVTGGASSGGLSAVAIRYV
jgi:hypothetical protein